MPPSPRRLGAGAPCARRAAGDDHRRELRPDNPAWRDAFARLQERGRVVFTAAVDGAVYAKHGTTIETRLTVIDKLPADDPAVFPAVAGVAPDVATLLGWIDEQLPPRLPVDRSDPCRPHGRRAAPCAAISPAATAAPRPLRPSPRASNSPMRPWTGRRRGRPPVRCDL
jgi:hypothetical protein